jgi:molybdate transport system substrate-binding protein
MRDADMTRGLIPLLVLLMAAACESAATTPKPPLRVFSSNGVRALLEDAQPGLERAAGRPIAFEFSTAAALRRRIEGGEVPDVAVLTSALVDELAARGTLASESRRDLARVGVGVGVRIDAPSAAIATADEFKAFLLAANSVVFTAEGQSRATIDAAFTRLGIVDEMRAKTLLKGAGEAPGVVGRGEAEVVLTLASELVDVPGLKLIGPFPPTLQNYVTFTAARSPAATDVVSADRLLQALGGADVAAQLPRFGLEPATPRP